MMLIAASATSLVLFLAIRWTLPPILAIPAALLWLVLFGSVAHRSWRLAVALLATLPVGFVGALALASMLFEMP
jgi:multidrug efflux pump subunit AcrB